MESERNDDDFLSLVEGVIDDALDLLTKTLSERIAPGGNMDELMAGALGMDPSNTEFLGSADITSLGAQAAYIVKKVYGEKPGNEWAIPQTAYFERFTVEPDTINVTISRLKKNILESKNPDRDRYNLCLNVTVNLWIDNINRNESEKHRKPKEGVYIRDAEDTLYLYEEGEK